MGEYLRAGLTAAFGNHPNTGDIRSGKGLLRREFVEDRPTRKNFPSELKFAASLRREMMKRRRRHADTPCGRPRSGAGDILFFAHRSSLPRRRDDRLVSVARDAVDAVLGVLT